MATFIVVMIYRAAAAFFFMGATVFATLQVLQAKGIQGLSIPVTDSAIFVTFVLGIAFSALEEAWRK